MVSLVLCQFAWIAAASPTCFGLADFDCVLLPFAVDLYELCASRVSEILRNKVHRTEEVQHVDFYAFSYYYDLAASFGLIGKGQGSLGRGLMLAISCFAGLGEMSKLRR